MPTRPLWPAGLLLVLVAPALAASIGPGKEPHYSGWDIETKFKGIDRKLRLVGELYHDHRGTVRRIAELESELRGARRDIRELQLQLRALNATLEEFKGEMVALREAARKHATPDDPGSKGAGETTPEPQGPVAEVVGDQMTHRLGFCTVSGRVRNLTDRPLTFIVVQVDFLDKDGEVVGSSAGYTSPAVIAPNATAAFKIQVRDSRRIRTHRVAVGKKR